MEVVDRESPVNQHDYDDESEVEPPPLIALSGNDVAGALPFYSTSSEETAEALLAAARAQGIIVHTHHGQDVAVDLYKNQTLDNLYTLGDQFAELHKEMNQ